MTASKVGLVSNIGRREVNQDRACVEPTTVAGEPGVVLAIADGMGGMRGGDRAAEIAIETVREYAARGFATVPTTGSDGVHPLWQVFQDANTRVWQWAEREGCAGQSGTTLVCCLVFGKRYVVAHTGDSRCYYVNDHEVRQLTEDHTRVQDMLRRNLMTPDAARRSPFRNELIHSLGEPHPVQVDIQPSATQLGIIDEPCAFLVSSDGVHGHVSDGDIRTALASTASVADASARLVAMALAHGATDNATVAALECGELASRVIASPQTVKVRAPLAPKTVKLDAWPVPTRRPKRRWHVASLAALGVLLIGGVTLAASARVRAALFSAMPAPVHAWFGGGGVAPAATSNVNGAREADVATASPPVDAATSEPSAAASTTEVATAAAAPVPPRVAVRPSARDEGHAPAAPAAVSAPQPTSTSPGTTSTASPTTAITPKGLEVAWRPVPGASGYWLEIARSPGAVHGCGAVSQRHGDPPIRTVGFTQTQFVWKPTVIGGIYVRVVAQVGRRAECSAWVSTIVR